MDISKWQWNRIFVIAIVLLLFYFSAPIYLLVIFALILSMLLLSPVKWIEEKLGCCNFSEDNRRNIAVCISFLLFLVVLLGTFYFVFRPLVREIASFLVILPDIINDLQIRFLEFLSTNQNQYLALPTKVKEVINQGAEKALAFTISQFNSLISILFGVGPILVQAVLIPFLVYYFLRDRENLLASTTQVFPIRKRDRIEGLFREISAMLSSYVQGQLLVCAITGLIVFAGTSLLGVKYPLVLGVLAFFLETVPYIGPFLAFIPAFVLGASVSLDLALKVVAFYLFVSFLENYIIVPKIMGKVVKTHPLVILLGMMLAANWFGLIGMMLAVPAMAILRILIQFIWKWR